MADIQILVDKSPLPPGFSPVCDPLDSSEDRFGAWGWGSRPRPCVEVLGGGGISHGGTTGARLLSFGRLLFALGDDRVG